MTKLRNKKALRYLGHRLKALTLLHQEIMVNHLNSWEIEQLYPNGKEEWKHFTLLIVLVGAIKERGPSLKCNCSQGILVLSAKLTEYPIHSTQEWPAEML